MTDKFGGAEPWTLGVEEELFFVDAETLEAAPGFSRVGGGGDQHVKPEVFESIVEVATGVLPDAGAVLEDLTKRRSAIAERAASHGLRIYGSGTHPLAHAYDQAIVPVRRYQKMIESLGDAMRRQFVCGLHVHVSIPDPDTALRAFEWVVPWLPVLLALSANSPYAEGEDTGRRSERAARLLLLPTGGTPPVLRSWDDWRAAPDRHFDAWPRPEYGTLEVRVLDMQTDVRRSAGFAAIVRALALTVPGTVDTEPFDRVLYARKREEASRLPPDPEEAEALAALVETHLHEHERELARLVLDGRPEAERQLELGIAATPRDVVERTLG